MRWRNSQAEHLTAGLVETTLFKRLLERLWPPLITGRGSDRDWHKIGMVSPWYGVISDSTYAGKTIDEDKITSFYRTGEEWVEHLKKVIEINFNTQFKFNRGLDFGCGLGRVTIPLSAYCNQVVGMDVSEPMLNIAHSRSPVGRDIVYLKSDDNLSKIKNEKFDFVHTYIVLQHIPVLRGVNIMEGLIDDLDSGGIAVIHYTFHKVLPFRREISRLLRRFALMNKIFNVMKGNKNSEPFIGMYVYDPGRVFQLMVDRGINSTYCEFTNYGGYSGIVMFIKKRSLKSGTAID